MAFPAAPAGSNRGQIFSSVSSPDENRTRPPSRRALVIQITAAMTTGQGTLPCSRFAHQFGAGGAIPENFWLDSWSSHSWVVWHSPPLTQNLACPARAALRTITSLPVGLVLAQSNGAVGTGAGDGFADGVAVGPGSVPLVGAGGGRQGDEARAGGRGGPRLGTGLEAGAQQAGLAQAVSPPAVVRHVELEPGEAGVAGDLGDGIGLAHAGELEVADAVAGLGPAGPVGVGHVRALALGPGGGRDARERKCGGRRRPRLASGRGGVTGVLARACRRAHARGGPGERASPAVGDILGLRLVPPQPHAVAAVEVLAVGEDEDAVAGLVDGADAQGGLGQHAGGAVLDAVAGGDPQGGNVGLGHDQQRDAMFAGAERRLRRGLAGRHGGLLLVGGEAGGRYVAGRAERRLRRLVAAVVGGLDQSQPGGVGRVQGAGLPAGLAAGDQAEEQEGQGKAEGEGVLEGHVAHGGQASWSLRARSSQRAVT
ncbi:MAG: hypothetical protein UY36_C0001G0025 [Parcubacteria group bacterium GW2011_GWA1_49_11]|nr:MAG: hypothetical protein UY36_C0001G0025 [Parcubacteria group bacterium GW2011_GWA1_49_11]